MLHPVGDLPAAVYWRRRLLALVLLVAVLGGGAWLLVAAATGGGDGSTAAAASGDAEEQPPAPPALEQVVPSLASVQTPTPVPTTEAPAAAPEPAAGPPAPVPGGPCTDDMIGLEVRTPGSIPVGGRPTFELVVSNLSAVPCVRSLDKGLQEIVLLDLAGNRVWGSNDCLPEASSDLRTLAPGESVVFPLVWSGLTSEPTCTAARVPPAAGQYLVRGRLDTKTSPDASLAIG